MKNTTRYALGMVYRGRMDHGVVVLEGERPPDGTWVEVTPAADPAANPSAVTAGPIADHPAPGLWKDRTDLPDDAVEASEVLREGLMRRTDDTAK
jgi:hypothetical protein